MSNTIVLNQVYGGGGNSGATLKNDFIELFNRGSATVDVTGWSIQYTSAAGTTWQKTDLSGTIAPGQYYLVQEAQGSGGTATLPTPDVIGTLALSATAGKIALINNNGLIASGTACPSGPNVVDFVGFGSNANCFEGTGPSPAPSSTHAILRLKDGCTDTDNNSMDFNAGTPNPRNSASPKNSCGTTTNPSGVGGANPGTVMAGGSTLLTVAVTPGSNPISTGITVRGDLTPIGGSATQQFYDDGTHGDVTAGDNAFSFQATVGAGTSNGAKSLRVTISDAELRTASVSIDLTAQSSSLIAIHDIQGSGAFSPHQGELVTTAGIVTAVKSNAFFLQTRDSEIDGDPNTSEGIVVFTSSVPPPAAAVGNEVTVTGTVLEYVPASDPSSPSLTQLSEPVAVTLVSTGNPLPVPVTLTAADLSPSGPIQHLGKFEGMRVHADSLTVVAPTQGYLDETNATSTSNGVFYAVLTGTPRPFREPGIELPDPLPPGSPCCIPRFDANPERLRVDSVGLVGGAPLEVTVGAVVTNITGPLDYAFRTYTILPDPATPPGISGNISAIPVPTPKIDELTVGTLNLERFYDSMDDPSTTEPVLTTTAFNHRLNKASLAIRNVMRMPDIIGVEEVENLVTLQSLAEKINNDAAATGELNPKYQAYLVEGNDPSGIDVGFLANGSRVNVIEVVQVGKTDTYRDPATGQQVLLNDRPPLVMRATILKTDPSVPPVTVIVSHLRSLSGINDTAEGARVRAKRAAQAEYLANLLQSRQSADPREAIISIGDYNAFQFNDGYVDVMGTVLGTPAPSDQVILPSSDLVNPELLNLTDRAPVEQRYSFSLDGNAQALDHIVISANLLPRFTGIHMARCNADFPESFRNDANRPERMSDHDMPVAYFSFPSGGADLSVVKNYSSDPVQPGILFGYLLAVMNNGPEKATLVVMNDTLATNTTFQSITPPAGWTCAVPPVGSNGILICTDKSLEVSILETFLVTVKINCSIETGTTLASTATIQSSEADSNLGNNSTTSTVTVVDPTTISPPSQMFGASGGSGTVRVSIPGDCRWTAVSNDRWITITSSDSGAGSATLSYRVAPNNGTSSRGGSMTVAGRTFSVSQMGSGGGNTQLSLVIPAGGVSSAATQVEGGNVRAGYATVTADPSKRGDGRGNLFSESGPEGTAVLSLIQNGVVVSEVGVPASPPTTSALLFIDYRSTLKVKWGREIAQSSQVNTGLAVVNQETVAANIAYRLRGSTGEVLATGHGTLAQGAHRALFIHELNQIAPDFILPPDFSTAAGFGTVEITSDQPISILGLRLTMSQRGDTLLTSTPISDLTRPVSAEALFFPQWVEGGGYTTSIILLNNSDSVEAGTLRIFDNRGAGLMVRQSGNDASPASAFSYRIEPRGFYVFQTEGSPSTVLAGWAQVEPDKGTSTPVGAGVLSYTTEGILRSETGIPSAIPSTHARIYVDRSGGHNTGIAIADPSGTGLRATLKAFQVDGNTATGIGTLELVGHGHDAKFANEYIPAIPEGFTGVLDVSSPSPFVALTLRALTNAKGDFLMTTFPIVDLNQTTPAPLIFPQIAAGGGYETQCIVFGKGSETHALISYYGDDGAPLNVGKTADHNKER
ncbi:MAG: DUF11 domain-containing protein [Acidobacteriia bacterium]|nr:DUF11 domain-containing protein [Terriglobia bacterium]